MRKLNFVKEGKNILTWIGESIFGKIVAFFGFLGILHSLGILSPVLTHTRNFLLGLLRFLQFSFWNLPVFLWLLLLLLAIWLESQRRKVNLVAGEFKENFDKGLIKWEFGGEGWKTEHDSGQSVLSVSESQDGGITKKGFSWADYEFSFETKVIKYASGWIVRAENRNKYFMIQLNLKNPNQPRLRPHLRVNDVEYPWIALEESSVSLNDLHLKKKIKLLDWIQVKIIVRGSEIDISLNGEHALHYFLPDPYRFEKQKKIFTNEGKEEVLKREIVIVSYPIGRVGFRCAPPNEHAHFKKVRVKPIL